MHKPILVQNTQRFQNASRNILDLLLIQGCLIRRNEKVTLKIFQSNGDRKGLVLDLVDHWSKVASTILKPPEDVSFIFDSWMAFDAFYHYSVLQLVSGDSQLLRNLE
jgi:hypothetical protein